MVPQIARHFFIFENGHLKIYNTLLYPGKSREIRYLMKYIRIFEFLEGFKLSIFALDCVINPNPLSPSPAQLTSSDEALFRKKEKEKMKINKYIFS